MLQRKENENEEQYIWRLGRLKDSGKIALGWDQLANIINKELNLDSEDYKNESAYRKPYQQAKRFFEAGVFKDYSQESYIELLRSEKQEAFKERQKLRDERVSYNKELREQSRRESVFEIMKRAIDEYKPIEFDYVQKLSSCSENDFIIHLTDVHCGVETDSAFNKFNSDILADRLKNYLNQIKELCDLYHPQNAYLILGGDMIHGLIHINARIESKENVVNQLMIVSDYIANFVNELRSMFEYVEVHTTIGNHARLTPNKDEALHGENLDLLIPYICKRDFRNCDDVKFVDNDIDCDIAHFMVRGYSVYAAHGDKDNAKSVVYNMTKFARKTGNKLPDMCFLGHRHTNGLTTVDEVKVIESGCVDGMDSYCVEQRLIGRPEQTVTVVSADKMIKAFCDIQID